MDPTLPQPPKPTLKQQFLETIKTYRYTSIATGVLLFLFTIFIVQRIIISIQVSYVTSQQEKANLQQKQADEQAYQKLLEKQEKEDTVTPTTTVDKKRQAKGTFTVHIVFVKPPSIADSDITPLITELEKNNTDIFTNCPTCEKQVSLAYIPTFINNQAKHYRQKDFSLKLQTHGPYTLEHLEAIGDMMYLWGKDPFGMIKLEDAFGAIAKKNNISQKDTDVTLYLYFDNSYAPSVEDQAEDRFYEHKAFRSFAEPNLGSAFINIYNFSPSFSKTAVEILTHEMLHLFGSTDKYEEFDTKRVCSIKGRGDLEKKPAVPQTTGDIMCMFIEKEHNKFDRARMIDKTLVINQKTAEEIGWKK